MDVSVGPSVICCWILILLGFTGWKKCTKDFDWTWVSQVLINLSSLWRENIPNRETFLGFCSGGSTGEGLKVVESVWSRSLSHLPSALAQFGTCRFSQGQMADEVPRCRRVSWHHVLDLFEGIKAGILSVQLQYYSTTAGTLQVLHWVHISITCICFIKINVRFFPGTEHDVLGRWQRSPTTGSVAWVWPTTPRSEVGTSEGWQYSLSTRCRVGLVADFIKF